MEKGHTPCLGLYYVYLQSNYRIFIKRLPEACLKAKANKPLHFEDDRIKIQDPDRNFSSSFGCNYFFAKFRIFFFNGKTELISNMNIYIYILVIEI